jgi:hypothetical protein
MQFVDNSAETQAELKVSAGGANSSIGPVVNMGAEGARGVGFTAGNAGHSGYGVALGFSEGSDPVTAHRLAARVLDAVGAHWHVNMVPPGQGAEFHSCTR